MSYISEAHDTLFSCLRFGPDHLPYDPKVDDRNPTALMFPPDKPYSHGPNQVWNALACLQVADVMRQTNERDLQDVLAVVDSLIAGWGTPAFLVAAVEWRSARLAETEDP